MLPEVKKSVTDIEKEIAETRAALAPKKRGRPPKVRPLEEVIAAPPAPAQIETSFVPPKEVVLPPPVVMATPKPSSVETNSGIKVEVERNAIQANPSLKVFVESAKQLWQQYEKTQDPEHAVNAATIILKLKEALEEITKKETSTRKLWEIIES
jgi:hypothetical protein